MINLQDIKQNYLNSANQIPNWKSISKKELANKYLENRDTNPTLANSYISCLIVTYWPLLISFQQSCGTSQIDNAIAYNRLIDAMSKLFKYKPRLDPTTKIYDDERAIDKAMFAYMRSSRANELVANSLQKRRLNINCYSTDELNEENSSGVYTASNENLTTDVSIHGLVQCFIDGNDNDVYGTFNRNGLRYEWNSVFICLYYKLFCCLSFTDNNRNALCVVCVGRI